MIFFGQIEGVLKKIAYIVTPPSAFRKQRRREREIESEMMMMGEGIHRNPRVDVPPWPVFDDHLPVPGLGSTAAGDSYLLSEALMAAALQRYLPVDDAAETDECPTDLVDPPADAYSCDEFRIYEFKVRRCARARSHDWTDCPFAHPGEKARRRDPRKFHYSGAACPDFRKGSCRRGDACEYAHGVFECWLHPARYRTQPCKDGTACRRRVCFFAHTPEQLRVLPQQQQTPARVVSAPLESYDGSPLRARAVDGFFGNGVISSSSPRSTLISVSPPLSPTADSPPISPMNEALASLMRKLQLSKVQSVPWAISRGGVGIGFNPGFCSSPSTPVRATVAGAGIDGFEEAGEPVERVESGRALRAKMYERLSRDSGLGRSEAPDVGWVSELVK